jgi:GNAT superfamily N-acetyltransferase
VIRPATVADARALAELEVRAWRWAYVDIVAEQEMITVDERAARWSSAGAVEGAFVAEVGGRVAGVVQVGLRPEDGPVVAGALDLDAGSVGPAVAAGTDPGGRPAGQLGVLAVEPAAQGAGLGTALYEHAIAELQAAGSSAAVVWLFDGDGHARGFYERRGWRADGATGTVAEASALRYRHTLAP